MGEGTQSTPVWVQTQFESNQIFGATRVGRKIKTENGKRDRFMYCCRTQRPLTPARRVPQNPAQSAGFCTSASPTAYRFRFFVFCVITPSKLVQLRWFWCHSTQLNESSWMSYYEFSTFWPQISAVPLMVFVILNTCISAHSWVRLVFVVSFDSSRRALSNDI